MPGQDDLLVFATARQQVMDDLVATLRRSVTIALSRYPQEGWSAALLRRLGVTLRKQYRSESERLTSPALRSVQAALLSNAEAALERTEPDEDRATQAERITELLAVAVANAVTEVLAMDSDTPMVKTWVTMEDAAVRPEHREANRQSVPVGSKFTVAGIEMDRPGDISAPIGLWIGCRCVLAVSPAARVASGILDGGGTMEMDDLETGSVPFYGVLAPEGVPTADGRKFAVDSMRWRELPIPMLWQKVTGEGHDGSVTVGVIEQIERRQDGNLWYGGHMVVSPEADEAIGLMAEKALRGVSVDVYDATMEMQDLEGQTLTDEDLSELEADVQVLKVLTDGEIAGATLCAFPAFREAFVALGTLPDAEAPEAEDELVDGLAEADTASAVDSEEFVDEGSWDGSAANYTPEQWYRATVVHLSDDKENKSDHKLPIRTPSGELSRAGVHAAASRLNQVDAPPEKINTAKASLRSAYKELGEDPPEVLAASEGAEQFIDVAPGKTEDGPGWLTHPVDTDRLRDYWVRGAGAAKIGWGAPGDFNRCRALLAEYVKPQHLSGYCANRHKDALGIWPGEHSATRDSVVASGGVEPWTLVASGSSDTPPKEWFEDPGLIEPSPLVVTEDGRVFGHLATWDTCHIAVSGTCTTPPHSVTDYSYFRLNRKDTADGPVTVGKIVLGTGHANTRLRAAAATAHYDNTGYAVCDVAAGEDQYGIWVAGALSPNATQEQIDTLRSSSLSGDWREVRGNLELVGAVVVNVPGFPIPRTSLAAAGGHQISLVASGIVARDEYTTQDIEQIVRRVLSEDKAAQQARANLSAIARGRARKELQTIAARRGGQ